MRKKPSAKVHPRLTRPVVPWTPARLVEMVGLVQRGATDDEIAAELGMCPNQVASRRPRLTASDADSHRGKRVPA